MHTIIKASELSSHLTWVVRHQDKNPTNPAATALTLTQNEGGITISGGGQDTWAATTLPHPGNDINISVHGRMLLDAAKAFGAADVTLTVNQQGLTLTKGRSRTTTPPMPPPTPMNIGGMTPLLTVPDGALQAALCLTGACTDHGKDAIDGLMGVHMSLKGNEAVFVGTNRYQAGMVKLAVNTPRELNGLLPMSVVREIVGAPKCETLTVDADAAGNAVRVRIGSRELVTRLLHPGVNVMTLWGKTAGEDATVVECDSAALLDALRLAILGADDSGARIGGRRVNAKVVDDVLVLSSTGENVGDVSEGAVPYSHVNGPAWSEWVTINALMLRNVVANMGAPRIRVHTNMRKRAPMVITPAHTPPHFSCTQALIMPIVSH